MNKETPFRSKFIRRVGNMKSRIPSSNALLMSNIVDGKSNNDEGNESLDKDLSIESEVTGNNNPDTNSKLQEDDVYLSTYNTNNLLKASEKAKSIMTFNDHEHEVISVKETDANPFKISFLKIIKENIRNYKNNGGRDISPIQFNKYEYIIKKLEFL